MPGETVSGDGHWKQVRLRNGMIFAVIDGLGHCRAAAAASKKVARRDAAAVCRLSCRRVAASLRRIVANDTRSGHESGGVQYRGLGGLGGSVSAMLKALCCTGNRSCRATNCCCVTAWSGQSLAHASRPRNCPFDPVRFVDDGHRRCDRRASAEYVRCDAPSPPQTEYWHARARARTTPWSWLRVIGEASRERRRSGAPGSVAPPSVADYPPSLQHYLADGGESALHRAYEIGRPPWAARVDRDRADAPRVSAASAGAEAARDRDAGVLAVRFAILCRMHRALRNDVRRLSRGQYGAAPLQRGVGAGGEANRARPSR